MEVEELPSQRVASIERGESFEVEEISRVSGSRLLRGKASQFYYTALSSFQTTFSSSVLEDEDEGDSGFQTTFSASVLEEGDKRDSGFQSTFSPSNLTEDDRQDDKVLASNDQKGGADSRLQEQNKNIADTCSLLGGDTDGKNDFSRMEHEISETTRLSTSGKQTVAKTFDQTVQRENWFGVNDGNEVGQHLRTENRFSENDVNGFDQSSRSENWFEENAKDGSKHYSRSENSFEHKDESGLDQNSRNENSFSEENGDEFGKSYISENRFQATDFTEEKPGGKAEIISFPGSDDSHSGGVSWSGLLDADITVPEKLEDSGFSQKSTHSKAGEYHSLDSSLDPAGELYLPFDPDSLSAASDAVAASSQAIGILGRITSIERGESFEAAETTKFKRSQLVKDSKPSGDMSLFPVTFDDSITEESSRENKIDWKSDFAGPSSVELNKTDKTFKNRDSEVDDVRWSGSVVGGGGFTEDRSLTAHEVKVSDWLVSERAPVARNAEQRDDLSENVTQLDVFAIKEPPLERLLTSDLLFSESISRPVTFERRSDLFPSGKGLISSDVFQEVDPVFAHARKFIDSDLQGMTNPEYEWKEETEYLGEQDTVLSSNDAFVNEKNDAVENVLPLVDADFKILSSFPSMERAESFDVPDSKIRTFQAKRDFFVGAGGFQTSFHGLFVDGDEKDSNENKVQTNHLEVNSPAPERELLLSNWAGGETTTAIKRSWPSEETSEIAVDRGNNYVEWTTSKKKKTEELGIFQSQRTTADHVETNSNNSTEESEASDYGTDNENNHSSVSYSALESSDITSVSQNVLESETDGQTQGKLDVLESSYEFLDLALQKFPADRAREQQKRITEYPEDRNSPVNSAGFESAEENTQISISPERMPLTHSVERMESFEVNIPTQIPSPSGQGVNVGAGGFHTSFHSYMAEGQGEDTRDEMQNPEGFHLSFLSSATEDKGEYMRDAVVKDDAKRHFNSTSFFGRALNERTEGKDNRDDVRRKVDDTGDPLPAEDTETRVLKSTEFHPGRTSSDDSASTEGKSEAFDELRSVGSYLHTNPFLITDSEHTASLLGPKQFGAKTSRFESSVGEDVTEGNFQTEAEEIRLTFSSPAQTFLTAETEHTELSGVWSKFTDTESCSHGDHSQQFQQQTENTSNFSEEKTSYLLQHRLSPDQNYHGEYFGSIGHAYLEMRKDLSIKTKQSTNPFLEDYDENVAKHEVHMQNQIPATLHTDDSGHGAFKYEKQEDDVQDDLHVSADAFSVSMPASMQDTIYGKPSSLDLRRSLFKNKGNLAVVLPKESAGQSGSERNQLSAWDAEGETDSPKSVLSRNNPFKEDTCLSPLGDVDAESTYCSYGFPIDESPEDIYRGFDNTSHHPVSPPKEASPEEPEDFVNTSEFSKSVTDKPSEEANAMETSDEVGNNGDGYPEEETLTFSKCRKLTPKERAGLETEDIMEVKKDNILALNPFDVPLNVSGENSSEITLSMNVNALGNDASTETSTNTHLKKDFEPRFTSAGKMTWSNGSESMEKEESPVMSELTRRFSVDESQANSTFQQVFQASAALKEVEYNYRQWSQDPQHEVIPGDGRVGETDSPSLWPTTADAPENAQTGDSFGESDESVDNIHGFLDDRATTAGSDFPSKEPLPLAAEVHALEEVGVASALRFTSQNEANQGASSQFEKARPEGFTEGFTVEFCGFLDDRDVTNEGWAKFEEKSFQARTEAVASPNRCQDEEKSVFSFSDKISEDLDALDQKRKQGYVNTDIFASLLSDLPVFEKQTDSGNEEMTNGKSGLDVIIEDSDDESSVAVGEKFQAAKEDYQQVFASPGSLIAAEASSQSTFQSSFAAFTNKAVGGLVPTDISIDSPVSLSSQLVTGNLNEVLWDETPQKTEHFHETSSRDHTSPQNLELLSEEVKNASENILSELALKEFNHKLESLSADNEHDQESEAYVENLAFESQTAGTVPPNSTADSTTESEPGELIHDGHENDENDDVFAAMHEGHGQSSSEDRRMPSLSQVSQLSSTSGSRTGSRKSSSDGSTDDVWLPENGMTLASPQQQAATQENREHAVVEEGYDGFVPSDDWARPRPHARSRPQILSSTSPSNSEQEEEWQVVEHGSRRPQNEAAEQEKVLNQDAWRDYEADDDDGTCSERDAPVLADKPLQKPSEPDATLGDTMTCIDYSGSEDLPDDISGATSADSRLLSRSLVFHRSSVTGEPSPALDKSDNNESVKKSGTLLNFELPLQKSELESTEVNVTDHLLIAGSEEEGLRGSSDILVDNPYISLSPDSFPGKRKFHESEDVHAEDESASMNSSETEDTVSDDEAMEGAPVSSESHDFEVFVFHRSQGEEATSKSRGEKNETVTVVPPDGFSEHGFQTTELVERVHKANESCEAFLTMKERSTFLEDTGRQLSWGLSSADDINDSVFVEGKHESSDAADVFAVRSERKQRDAMSETSPQTLSVTEMSSTDELRGSQGQLDIQGLSIFTESENQLWSEELSPRIEKREDEGDQSSETDETEQHSGHDPDEILAEFHQLNENVPKSIAIADEEDFVTSEAQMALERDDHQQPASRHGQLKKSHEEPFDGTLGSSFSQSIDSLSLVVFEKLAAAEIDRAAERGSLSLNDSGCPSISSLDLPSPHQLSVDEPGPQTLGPADDVFYSYQQQEKKGGYTDLGTQQDESLAEDEENREKGQSLKDTNNVQEHKSWLDRAVTKARDVYSSVEEKLRTRKKRQVKHDIPDETDDINSPDADSLSEREDEESSHEDDENVNNDETKLQQDTDTSLWAGDLQPETVQRLNATAFNGDTGELDASPDLEPLAHRDTARPQLQRLASLTSESDITFTKGDGQQYFSPDDDQASSIDDNQFPVAEKPKDLQRHDALSLASREKEVAELDCLLNAQGFRTPTVTGVEDKETIREEGDDELYKPLRQPSIEVRATEKDAESLVDTSESNACWAQQGATESGSDGSATEESADVKESREGETAEKEDRAFKLSCLEPLSTEEYSDLHSDLHRDFFDSNQWQSSQRFAESEQDSEIWENKEVPQTAASPSASKRTDDIDDYGARLVTSSLQQVMLGLDVKDEIFSDHKPAVEEQLVSEEAPVSEEMPVNAKEPVSEEALVSEEKPVSEEALVSEEKPVSEEALVSEEKPVQEDQRISLCELVTENQSDIVSQKALEEDSVSISKSFLEEEGVGKDELVTDEETVSDDKPVLEIDITSKFEPVDEGHQDTQLESAPVEESDVEEVSDENGDIKEEGIFTDDESDPCGEDVSDRGLLSEDELMPGTMKKPARQEKLADEHESVTMDKPIKEEMAAEDVPVLEDDQSISQTELQNSCEWKDQEQMATSSESNVSSAWFPKEAWAQPEHEQVSASLLMEHFRQNSSSSEDSKEDNDFERDFRSPGREVAEDNFAINEVVSAELYSSAVKAESDFVINKKEADWSNNQSSVKESLLDQERVSSSHDRIPNIDSSVEFRSGVHPGDTLAETRKHQDNQNPLFFSEDQETDRIWGPQQNIADVQARNLARANDVSPDFSLQCEQAYFTHDQEEPYLTGDEDTGTAWKVSSAQIMLSMARDTDDIIPQRRLNVSIGVAQKHEADPAEDGYRCEEVSVDTGSTLPQIGHGSTEVDFTSPERDDVPTETGFTLPKVHYMSTDLPLSDGTSADTDLPLSQSKDSPPETSFTNAQIFEAQGDEELFHNKQEPTFLANFEKRETTWKVQSEYDYWPDFSSQYLSASHPSRPMTQTEVSAQVESLSDKQPNSNSSQENVTELPLVPEVEGVVDMALRQLDVAVVDDTAARSGEFPASSTELFGAEVGIYAEMGQEELSTNADSTEGEVLLSESIALQTNAQLPFFDTAQQEGIASIKSSETAFSSERYDATLERREELSVETNLQTALALERQSDEAYLGLTHFQLSTHSPSSSSEDEGLIFSEGSEGKVQASSTSDAENMIDDSRCQSRLSQYKEDPFSNDASSEALDQRQPQSAEGDAPQVATSEEDRVSSQPVLPDFGQEIPESSTTVPSLHLQMSAPAWQREAPEDEQGFLTSTPRSDIAPFLAEPFYYPSRETMPDIQRPQQQVLEVTEYREFENEAGCESSAEHKDRKESEREGHNGDEDHVSEQFVEYRRSRQTETSQLDFAKNVIELLDQYATESRNERWVAETVPRERSSQEEVNIEERLDERSFQHSEEEEHSKRSIPDEESSQEEAGTTDDEKERSAEKSVHSDSGEQFERSTERDYEEQAVELFGLPDGVASKMEMCVPPSPTYYESESLEQTGKYDVLKTETITQVKDVYLPFSDAHGAVLQPAPRKLSLDIDSNGEVDHIEWQNVPRVHRLSSSRDEDGLVPDEKERGLRGYSVEEKEDIKETSESNLSISFDEDAAVVIGGEDMGDTSSGTEIHFKDFGPSFVPESEMLLPEFSHSLQTESAIRQRYSDRAEAHETSPDERGVSGVIHKQDNDFGKASDGDTHQNQNAEPAFFSEHFVEYDGYEAVKEQAESEMLMSKTSAFLHLETSVRPHISTEEEDASVMLLKPRETTPVWFELEGDSGEKSDEEGLQTGKAESDFFPNYSRDDDTREAAEGSGEHEMLVSEDSSFLQSELPIRPYHINRAETECRMMSSFQRGIIGDDAEQEESYLQELEKSLEEIQQKGETFSSSPSQHDEQDEPSDETNEAVETDVKYNEQKQQADAGLVTPTLFHVKDTFVMAFDWGRQGSISREAFASRSREEAEVVESMPEAVQRSEAESSVSGLSEEEDELAEGSEQHEESDKQDEDDRKEDDEEIYRGRLSATEISSEDSGKEDYERVDEDKFAARQLSPVEEINKEYHEVSREETQTAAVVTSADDSENEDREKMSEDRFDVNELPSVKDSKEKCEINEEVFAVTHLPQFEDRCMGDNKEIYEDAFDASVLPSTEDSGREYYDDGHKVRPAVAAFGSFETSKSSAEWQERGSKFQEACTELGPADTSLYAAEFQQNLQLPTHSAVPCAEELIEKSFRNITSLSLVGSTEGFNPDDVTSMPAVEDQTSSDAPHIPERSEHHAFDDVTNVRRIADDVTEDRRSQVMYEPNVAESDTISDSDLTSLDTDTEADFERSRRIGDRLTSFTRMFKIAFSQETQSMDASEASDTLSKESTPLEQTMSFVSSEPADQSLESEEEESDEGKSTDVLGAWEPLRKQSPLSERTARLGSSEVRVPTSEEDLLEGAQSIDVLEVSDGMSKESRSLEQAVYFVSNKATERMLESDEDMTSCERVNLSEALTLELQGDLSIEYSIPHCDKLPKGISSEEDQLATDENPEDARETADEEQTKPFTRHGDKNDSYFKETFSMASHDNYTVASAETNRLIGEEASEGNGSDKELRDSSSSEDNDEMGRAGRNVNKFFDFDDTSFRSRSTEDGAHLLQRFDVDSPITYQKPPLVFAQEDKETPHIQHPIWHGDVTETTKQRDDISWSYEGETISATLQTKQKHFGHDNEEPLNEQARELFLRQLSKGEQDLAEESSPQSEAQQTELSDIEEAEDARETAKEEQTESFTMHGDKHDSHFKETFPVASHDNYTVASAESTRLTGEEAAEGNGSDNDLSDIEEEQLHQGFSSVSSPLTECAPSSEWYNQESFIEDVFTRSQDPTLQFNFSGHNTVESSELRYSVSDIPEDERNDEQTEKFDQPLKDFEENGIDSKPEQEVAEELNQQMKASEEKEVSKKSEELLSEEFEQRLKEFEECKTNNRAEEELHQELAQQRKELRQEQLSGKGENEPAEEDIDQQLSDSEQQEINSKYDWLLKAMSSTSSPSPAVTGMSLRIDAEQDTRVLGTSSEYTFEHSRTQETRETFYPRQHTVLLEAARDEQRTLLADFMGMTGSDKDGKYNDKSGVSFEKSIDLDLETSSHEIHQNGFTSSAGTAEMASSQVEIDGGRSSREETLSNDSALFERDVLSFSSERREAAMETDGERNLHVKRLSAQEFSMWHKTENFDEGDQLLHMESEPEVYEERIAFSRELQKPSAGLADNASVEVSDRPDPSNVEDRQAAVVSEEEENTLEGKGIREDAFLSQRREDFEQSVLSQSPARSDEKEVISSSELLTDYQFSDFQTENLETFRQTVSIPQETHAVGVLYGKTDFTGDLYSPVKSMEEFESADREPETGGCVGKVLQKSSDSFVDDIHDAQLDNERQGEEETNGMSDDQLSEEDPFVASRAAESEAEVAFLQHRDAPTTVAEKKPSELVGASLAEELMSANFLRATDFEQLSETEEESGAPSPSRDRSESSDGESGAEQSASKDALKSQDLPEPPPDIRDLSSLAYDATSSTDHREDSQESSSRISTIRKGVVDKTWSTEFGESIRESSPGVIITLSSVDERSAGNVLSFTTDTALLRHDIMYFEPGAGEKICIETDKHIRNEAAGKEYDLWERSHSVEEEEIVPLSMLSRESFRFVEDENIGPEFEPKVSFKEIRSPSNLSASSESTSENDFKEDDEHLTNMITWNQQEKQTITSNQQEKQTITSNQQEKQTITSNQQEKQPITEEEIVPLKASTRKTLHDAEDMRLSVEDGEGRDLQISYSVKWSSEHVSVGDQACQKVWETPSSETDVTEFIEASQISQSQASLQDAGLRLAASRSSEAYQRSSSSSLDDSLTLSVHHMTVQYGERADLVHGQPVPLPEGDNAHARARASSDSVVRFAAPEQQISFQSRSVAGSSEPTVWATSSSHTSAAFARERRPSADGSWEKFDQDHRPLIGGETLTEDSALFDQENVSPNSMPFEIFKKKNKAKKADDTDVAITTGNDVRNILAEPVNSSESKEKTAVQEDNVVNKTSAGEDTGMKEVDEMTMEDIVNEELFNEVFNVTEQKLEKENLIQETPLEDSPAILPTDDITAPVTSVPEGPQLSGEEAIGTQPSKLEDAVVDGKGRERESLLRDHNPEGLVCCTIL